MSTVVLGLHLRSDVFPRVQTAIGRRISFALHDGPVCVEQPATVRQ